MGFQRVIEILDQAIGGPDVRHRSPRRLLARHHRDEFVAKKVLGKPLVVPGDATASNLVRSLKGQAPFGSDLPEPPPGGSLRRMPAGRPAVPAESIAFIERWINDGCPEEPIVTEPIWRETRAPIASSRTDDIWFIDANRGWAVNSDGQIVHTEDGGATWREQFHDEDSGIYLRCVGFASDQRNAPGSVPPHRADSCWRRPTAARPGRT